MLPFKVAAVVVCDDIRIEQNNKAILIGVYNGALLVQGFPADIPLSWWIQIFGEKVGKFELDFQLVKDDETTLLRAIIGFEVSAVGWSSVALPRAPLQLQSPGRLKLQMKLKEDAEWSTIQELNISLGAPPT